MKADRRRDARRVDPTLHVGKGSSWSLLVVMTLTIVANLQHLKERVHVPA